jgi:hypothetical protein
MPLTDDDRLASVTPRLMSPLTLEYLTVDFESTDDLGSIFKV